MEKIASIDIGSNTLRLLIAEKTAEGFRPVYRDRAIVRLGRHFYPRRLLSQPALEEAVRVLKRFKNQADQAGVNRIMAVGTGVLRDAENSPVFLNTIKKETRLLVRIIPGEEEARLMARGVLSIFPPAQGKTVIFDIGGGSTEFVFMDKGQMTERISLPLGVVALTEQYLPSDPPKGPESAGLKSHCRNILKKNLPRNGIINKLIGTAGTVTTLAAMEQGRTTYDPDWINGTALTKERLLEISENFLALSFEKRAKLPGLEPGRADIITAGSLLVLEIMDHFSQDNLWVSDSGLLEGLIL